MALILCGSQPREIMMEKEKLKQLNNFIFFTNVIKYTLGLPILLFHSLRFLNKIGYQSILLLYYITVEPEKIRVTVDFINRLKTGMRKLWSSNQLRS